MNSKFDTRTITLIGVMSALCFFATWIHIPVNFGYVSMIHLGTAAIFIVAMLFGPVVGGLSAAIGLSIFDLTNAAFVAYAPSTFIIKGLTGLVAGLVMYRGKYEGDSFGNNLFGCISGGLVSLIGYYLNKALMQGDFISALQSMPSSIITTVIGIAIAIPVGEVLRRSLPSKALYRKKVLAKK